MAKLKTIEEIADWLVLSPSTLYKMVSGRKIPHIKLGNQLRFDVEEIQEWLDAHRVPPLTGGTDAERS